MNTKPIGVFDSGVGGISVLRELMKVMPHENYIYYGDNGNAPYGSKTTQMVKELSLNVAKELVKEDVKAIVIACNTATSASVKTIREMYKDLVVVGVEPAVKPAALQNPDKRVLVLATPVTLREEKYQKLVEPYRQVAEIISVPCEKLAKMIEEKESSEVVYGYLKEVLTPYLDVEPAAIVLGCTHYPFVSEIISRVVGYEVNIYDGGAGVARETKRRLEEKNAINTGGGSVKFLSSADPEILRKFASMYI